jgi:hypothetical protein
LFLHFAAGGYGISMNDSSAEGDQAQSALAWPPLVMSPLSRLASLGRSRRSDRNTYLLRQDVFDKAMVKAHNKLTKN